MSEAARPPVAVPGLADVLADPEVLDRVPVEMLVALRRQVRVLSADIEEAITRRLMAGFQGHGLGDVEVLTTGRLAELWGMRDSKIRELCRTGRIPARKLGPKVWVVPTAALRRWALDDFAVPGYGADHGRDSVREVRRQAVEIRRPARRAATPESA